MINILANVLSFYDYLSLCICCYLLICPCVFRFIYVLFFKVCMHLLNIYSGFAFLYILYFSPFISFTHWFVLFFKILISLFGSNSYFACLTLVMQLSLCIGSAHCLIRLTKWVHFLHRNGRTAYLDVIESYFCY